MFESLGLTQKHTCQRFVKGPLSSFRRAGKDTKQPIYQFARPKSLAIIYLPVLDVGVTCSCLSPSPCIETSFRCVASAHRAKPTPDSYRALTRSLSRLKMEMITRHYFPYPSSSWCLDWTSVRGGWKFRLDKELWLL